VVTPRAQPQVGDASSDPQRSDDDPDGTGDDDTDGTDGIDGIDGGGTDGGAALFAACARVAADRGCQLLVSLGADGALWTDGASTVHAATEPVVARNTAGAGDALLAGWLAGGPPAERLARAVGWGRATCLSATTVADPAALAAAAEVAVQVTSHTH